MRVKTKANVTITNGTNNEDTLFGPDDTAAESVLDGFQESADGKATLAAAAVLSPDFSHVDDPKGVFVRSTGDFDLVINGVGPLPVRRGVASVTTGNSVKATYARLLLEADVTSIQITAVEDSDILWAVWGNPLTP